MPRRLSDASLKLVTLLICAETWPRPFWSTVTLGEIVEGWLGELALCCLLGALPPPRLLLCKKRHRKRDLFTTCGRDTTHTERPADLCMCAWLRRCPPLPPSLSPSSRWNMRVMSLLFAVARGEHEGGEEGCGRKSDVLTSGNVHMQCPQNFGIWRSCHPLKALNAWS